MRSTTVRFSLAVIGLALLASAHSALGQTIDKRVIVTLPDKVMIADKALDAGKYTIHEVANHTLQVLDNDNKMRAEAAVTTIDTEDKQPAKETKLVLFKFPDSDEYYVDKMWIQGRQTGYEFPLPDRFKNLKREREESVTAQYEEKREEKEGLK
jgi:hypothetical protein